MTVIRRYAVPMHLLVTLVTFLPQADVVVRLPMAPWQYGALAVLGFLIALGVLWSFRNTGAKMSQGKGAHSDQVQRS